MAGTEEVHWRTWQCAWIASALTALMLLGCGSKVERNIKKLEGSQEEREQAKLELTLAKQDAIEPLIRALGDVSKSADVRVDIADILFRLYVREDDPRIMEALLRALRGGDPKVRAGVAMALGDMGKDEAIPPLMDALGEEDDDEVVYQILTALETLGTNMRQRSPTVSSGRLKEMRDRFIELLRHRSGKGSQRVQWKIREWLEVIAEEVAQHADQLLLQGNLEEAEKRYLEAKALVSDSKNINQKLGRFYFDNGEEGKGLDILREYGMVTYARRLSPPPAIDGVLDDECWREISPLTTFYQCIYRMAAYPIQGKSEAYVGYGQGSLFVGIKGYEASTQTLVARETERDGGVWEDDCVEIFVDTNHDYRTYYQIIINSLGTVLDVYNAGDTRLGDPEWDGTYTLATKVEDTLWTCEIGIPFKELGGAQVKKGTVWGFNVGRVRIGNASEYGQWVPTYGFAHRPGRFGFLFFE